MTRRRGTGFGPRSAVVLGGGIAGLAAAAALAPHLPDVTIVERDRFPMDPLVRTGVPQGRHTHGLVSGGARALETLLPGALDALAAAGAHIVDLPADTLIYGPYGWLPRISCGQFAVTCTRPLLEHVLRRQLLHRYPIVVEESTTATGLLGSADEVAGVRLRDRTTGRARDLATDLVIDATGRASRTPHWLGEFGLPPIPISTVDTGIAYVSQMIDLPRPGPAPIINIQADPRAGVPGRSGFLMLVEGGHWMLNFTGTRGAHPPREQTDLHRFAATLRHPLIGELLDAATPVSPPVSHGNTSNRRRHYHRLPRWPRGLLAVGDAVTTFNPVYAHGMSYATQTALAIADHLREHGGTLHTAQLQTRIGRLATLPWLISTIADIRYPDVISTRSARRTRMLHPYMDRFLATALVDPIANAAFTDLFTLSTPPVRMAQPQVLWATLRGPRHRRGGIDPEPLRSDLVGADDD